MPFWIYNDGMQVLNWGTYSTGVSLMDNFETELVVMGAKIALTNYKLPFDPSKLKSFDRFHKKFGKYVITAMESK